MWYGQDAQVPIHALNPPLPRSWHSRFWLGRRLNGRTEDVAEKISKRIDRLEHDTLSRLSLGFAQGSGGAGSGGSTPRCLPLSLPILCFAPSLVCLVSLFLPPSLPASHTHVIIPPPPNHSPPPTPLPQPLILGPHPSRSVTSKSPVPGIGSLSPAKAVRKPWDSGTSPASHRHDKPPSGRSSPTDRGLQSPTRTRRVSQTKTLGAGQQAASQSEHASEERL